MPLFSPSRVNSNEVCALILTREVAQGEKVLASHLLHLGLNMNPPLGLNMNLKKQQLFIVFSVFLIFVKKSHCGRQ